jgi:hypothetical protein
MEAIVPAVLVAALAFVPLAWRAWGDHQWARALVVRADVHRAVIGALGGESFVSVNVEPPGLRHPGRVILSAPAGWECLLEAAAGEALARTPATWELVVKPTLPAQPAAAHAGIARAAA